MSAGLKPAIALLLDGGILTRAEAAAAMGVIMDGAATDAQIGGFLAALRLRGERPGELLGFLDAFRDRAHTVRIDDPDAVDLCGTGGDGAGTINVSTLASFIVAGAGVTVAKHGNRAVSGRSGSADLLRELGVNIDLPPERAEACINTVGMGFLFAPIHHPAVRHASAARSELGSRTCFNLLGPLANPAGVRRQVIGTYSRSAAATIASVLGELAPESAYVVHSDDGLDEVSPSAPTRLTLIRGNKTPACLTITPETFGLAPLQTLDAVAGGSPAENAGVSLRVLEGARGAVREFALMNAAVGLCVARTGLSLADAFGRCADALDTGRARNVLSNLVEYTNR